MLRFVVIFLVFAAVAPLVPILVQSRLETANSAQVEASNSDSESGRRTHRIPRDRQGHFVAGTFLNGRAIDMLVDTGATVVALPEAVAEDIGIFLKNSDYKYSVSTANGTVYAARAVIDSLRIGDIRLRDLEALVLKDQSLATPLLGMSALNRLERFDISDGTLVLVQ
ncbi:retropepsin-like aspartic protease family protein [Roseibium sp.]|uniref:retropepsin-like aspartic protease family protein n=1 Tax=Roseibium sp. TaxID=1936156 RepID=UPI003D0F3F95